MFLSVVALYSSACVAGAFERVFEIPCMAKGRIVSLVWTERVTMYWLVGRSNYVKERFGFAKAVVYYLR